MQNEILQISNCLFIEEHQTQPLESNKRILAKTISCRATGTIDTEVISWLITGTLSLAFSIGAIEILTKMILYFLHERTWNHIAYEKSISI